MIHPPEQEDDVDAASQRNAWDGAVIRCNKEAHFEMHIKTRSLDLAKSVFQAHGGDKACDVVPVEKLHRKQMIHFFSNLPQCLIGVAACATEHHWARTLTAMGHEVRIMPPSYVKGYVKRGKSDAIDAEAICEAVSRPTMRFGAKKMVEQQSILMLHRTWALIVGQRTMPANALRAHLAELGLVANKAIDISDDCSWSVRPPLYGTRSAIRPL